MRRLKILRRWFSRKLGYARLICLALLVGIAALRVIDVPPIEELRVRVFDFYQRFEPRVKTTRPVAIVDIDETSLSKLGQWPWPRTRMAELVTNLARLGAVVIAFDVIFSEQDRLNPDVAAETFRNLDEDARAKLRALPSDDELFAEAIRRSRVVLGESGLPEPVAELDKSVPVTGMAMLGEDPQRFMFVFPGLLRNTHILESAAAGHGLLTIKPERDGIIRRVPMIVLAQGQTMPSMSFEMLRLATGTDTIIIKSDIGGIKSVGVRGLEIPTDRNGQLWVHYADNDPSLYVSAVDVLEGRVAPEKIAQHLVLVGTSAVGLERHQDHASFAGHAGCGNSRPSAGSSTDQVTTRAAALCPDPGIRRRLAARNSGDRVRAAIRTHHTSRRRRVVRERAGRNILVFLRGAPVAR